MGQREKKDIFFVNRADFLMQKRWRFLFLRILISDILVRTKLGKINLYTAAGVEQAISGRHHVKGLFLWIPIVIVS